MKKLRKILTSAIAILAIAAMLTSCALVPVEDANPKDDPIADNGGNNQGGSNQGGNNQGGSNQGGNNGGADNTLPEGNAPGIGQITPGGSVETQPGIDPDYNGGVETQPGINDTPGGTVSGGTVGGGTDDPEYSDSEPGYSGGEPGSSDGSEGATSFELDSSYFSVISVTPERLGEVRVAIFASVPYNEYSITVTLFTQDGTIITDREFSSAYGSRTATTIELTVPIYPENADTVGHAEIVVKATSSVYPEYYLSQNLPTVSFFHDSALWAKYEVETGYSTTVPDSPVVDGKHFDGWYTSEDGEDLYDLSSPVTSDTSAFSRHSTDFDGIINDITTDVIRSMVTIHCSYYRQNSFMASATSVSSGVIIAQGRSSSLVLTCCHCVQLPTGYSRMSITVEDYLGNTYSASVYNYNSANVIDPDYDLAYIEVSGLYSLPPIEIAEEDVEIGDTVIALGSPGGQQNAITTGEVIDFTTIELENGDPLLSNVTFEVIQHTALIKGGSSGGVILNSKLELVGINYAGNESQFDYGYSVPLSKIREFTYFYTGATL